MANTQHKGQLQVVEGSSSGDFYTTSKFDWINGVLVYLGELRLGALNKENKASITKFVYDNSGNISEILTAQNLSSLGCTNVTITQLNQDSVEVTLNNGDASEVSKDDGFRLKTVLNDISGTVIKATQNTIQVSIQPTTVTNETIAINEFDLTVRFQNEKTKDMESRRWDFRSTYIYI